MTVQTTYTENLRSAVAGARANTEPARIISRTAEEAAGLGFGVAVTQGTNDKGVIAFAGSGTILGITVRQRSLDANDPNKFAQYDEAQVMTKGVIWVTASVAVNAGDSVYVTDAGAFTNSASGTTQIAGARFDTSTTGEALAQVRLA